MKRDLRGNSCKRCGSCMSVCPVYQTTLREVDVARGKLALLETMDRRALERSRRFREILSRCLLCGACGEVCANGLQTKDLIQAGRRLLFETRRGRWFENPLVKGLREGELSGAMVSKGGALLQALCCTRIPQNSGLHLRFPLSFFTERSAIPAIAWTPFSQAFEAGGEHLLSDGKVALFLGCGADYLFPQSAWALVRVLQRLGVRIVLPKDQGCCGLPAYVAGDMKSARTLAIKNLEAFKTVAPEVVLTLCASCGAHLGNLGALFADDDPRRFEAEAFGAKHRDAMAFLMEALDLGLFLERHAGIGPFHENGVFKVAYHEPCHLRIGQKVGGGGRRDPRGPRRMLQALQGVDLVEDGGPAQCCGHGGGFNLAHYDLSMQILDRRIQSFRNAWPDAVATGCTGCLLQFQDGVAGYGLADRVEVCHPLVLVDRWLSRADQLL